MFNVLQAARARARCSALRGHLLQLHTQCRVAQARGLQQLRHALRQVAFGRAGGAARAPARLRRAHVSLRLQRQTQRLAWCGFAQALVDFGLHRLGIRLGVALAPDQAPPLAAEFTRARRVQRAVAALKC